MMDYHESVSPPWTTARPAVPFTEATRESSRAPVTQDLTVPAGVVAVGGLFVFLFVACIVFAIARFADWRVDILGVLLLSGAFGAVFDAVAYVMLTRHAWSGLSILTTVEKVTGVDWNRDGAVGAPAPVHRTSYSLPLAPGRWVKGDLSVDDAVLLDWCQAAKLGQSLAIAAWKAAFAEPDGTNGRAHYQEFVSELDDKGFIIRVGGNVGIKPSPAGWQFIDSFLMANEGTPLLAEGESDVE